MEDCVSLHKINDAVDMHKGVRHTWNPADCVLSDANIVEDQTCIMHTTG